MRRLVLVPLIVIGLSGLSGLAYAAGDDVSGSLGKGPLFDPSAPVTAQARPGDQSVDAGRHDNSGREGERLEHRNGERGEAREGGREDD